MGESNGTFHWTSNVMNGDDSSPAYGGGGVYVSYACPQAYGFEALKGGQLWHYSGPCEGGGGSTPVYANGNLYVSDHISNPLGYVFDGGSGTLLGRYNASTPSFFGLTSASISGVSYNTGGTVHAQDQAGNTLWSFAGDGTLVSNPIIVNHEVYVGGTSGNVYALNLTTGHQDWTASVGSSLQSTNGPTVGLGAGEGYLVVPATNTLTAFASAPGTTACYLVGRERRLAQRAGPWPSLRIPAPQPPMTLPPSPGVTVHRQQARWLPIPRGLRRYRVPHLLQGRELRDERRGNNIGR